MAHFGKTVIAAVGLGDPERAARALEDADFFSVGKMATANPDWVEKVKSGQPLNVAKNPIV